MNGHIPRVADFQEGDRIEVFDKDYMEWVVSRVDCVDRGGRFMVARPEDGRTHPTSQNLPLVYGIQEFLLGELVRGPL